MDARDAAQAIHKAIEWHHKGIDTFLIANADIVMGTPSAALVARLLRRDVAESLLRIGAIGY